MKKVAQRKTNQARPKLTIHRETLRRLYASNFDHIDIPATPKCHSGGITFCSLC